MSTEPNHIAVPDAVLDAFLTEIAGITESWAKRHDLWEDCFHKEPLKHYNDEPRPGWPFLLLVGDGYALQSLRKFDVLSDELTEALRAKGIFIELENGRTGAYQFVDSDHPMVKAFDQRARWRWVCKLVADDTHDVSGDLYEHFAGRPDDFHKLKHRDFERLVSSIFEARGWRTEIGPGSGDGGVDVRLWQADPLGEILTLVQVKRYAPNRPIHLEAVAALETHVHREGANRGLFVTSSRFLPGVREFAERDRYRLKLADSQDVQRWCEQNAFEARVERERATAPEALRAMLPLLNQPGPHPAIVESGRSRRDFCVVVKESRHAALLVRVGARLVSGDVMRGYVVPDLNGQTHSTSWRRTVFRAQRTVRDGRVSYWGDRQLFQVWDGQPSLDESWD